MGRPAMSPAKNGPVQMIRTESAAQVERWKAAARRDKRTLSDWIRLTLDEAAQPKPPARGEEE